MHKLALIQAILSGESCVVPTQFLQIGKAYLIRTVTHYWTGRVTAIDDKFVVLGDAAWIADTGRFSKALAEGKSVFNEIEPVPDGFAALSLGAIVDITTWKHQLPKEVK